MEHEVKMARDKGMLLDSTRNSAYLFWNAQIFPDGKNSVLVTWQQLGASAIEHYHVVQHTFIQMLFNLKPFT